MKRNILGAGLILAASAMPGIAQERADMRVGLLQAGATSADVERLMGQPTTATALGDQGAGGVALVFADEPVRTRLVLVGGKVTGIALDVVYVDPSSLPARAWPIKAMMTRDGVVGLLGVPGADLRWTEAGRDIEQMIFARPGETEFSLFLVDGLVVDAWPGRERPRALAGIVLPAPGTDEAVCGRLAIGLTQAQAAPLLGPPESTVHFALKGQPVEYNVYRERGGTGLVTVTFVGGVLTSFATWPAAVL